MKLLLLITLVICTNTYSYSQIENYRFCKEIISANNDHSVVTTFSIKEALTGIQISNLKTYLQDKKSIYAVKSNSKRTELYVYHLSKVHFEDLKLLIAPSNIELNFVSTHTVDFKNEYNTNIER